MRNWNSFLMASTAIIALILFASGKLEIEGMLDNVNLHDTAIAALKTLVIIVVATITLIIMIIVLLIDVLITIIFKSEFPILNLMYEYAYLQLVKNWYWDAHSGSNIFMACIILFGIGLISLYLGPIRKKKKKFIYHKKSDTLKY